jgi:hypothetical protein
VVLRRPEKTDHLRRRHARQEDGEKDSGKSGEEGCKKATKVEKKSQEVEKKVAAVKKTVAKKTSAAVRRSEEDRSSLRPFSRKLGTSPFSQV